MAREVDTPFPPGCYKGKHWLDAASRQWTRALMELGAEVTFIEQHMHDDLDRVANFEGSLGPEG